MWLIVDMFDLITRGSVPDEKDFLNDIEKKAFENDKDRNEAKIKSRKKDICAEAIMDKSTMEQQENPVDDVRQDSTQVVSSPPSSNETSISTSQKINSAKKVPTQMDFHDISESQRVVSSDATISLSHNETSNHAAVDMSGETAGMVTCEVLSLGLSTPIITESLGQFPNFDLCLIFISSNRNIGDVLGIPPRIDITTSGPESRTSPWSV